MPELVKCPSGLTGLITGLKGRSMRLLGDKQAVRSGLFLDKIFSACWQETVEPGPYQLDIANPNTSKPDWSRVLMGDRTYLLMQIRIHTFGSTFSFKVQCPNPGCRERFDHDLDLNDLPLKELSDADRKAFVDGNVLEGQLPEGGGFRFRLLTGADEVRAIKMGNSATDPLAMIKSRIHDMDGLDPRGRDLYFEDADWSTIYAILSEMDEHDCGVETKLALSCPECREAIDIDIPFGQGFLAPPKRPIQTTK